jgi:chromosomal replication initiation ATPase DnaA
MSQFKLLKNKKSINNGKIIAQVKGGQFDRYYLYMKVVKRKIEDLPDSFLNKLNDEYYELLDYAIHTGLEPEDERVNKLFYDAIELFEKKKTKGFQLGTGKLEVMPNPDVYERLFIAGQSGSGKSYFASQYIKRYLKMNRNNDFVLVSSVTDDDKLEKLEPQRIEPESLVQQGLGHDEIENNVVLFDDVLSIPNRAVKNAVLNNLNHLIETNRHTQTNVIIINHLLSNHHETRKIINEATSITFFPNTNKAGIEKYLKTYEGLNSNQIRKIVNLPSRAVTLYRGFNRYIVYDKGAFLI